MTELDEDVAKQEAAVVAANREAVQRIEAEAARERAAQARQEAEDDAARDAADARDAAKDQQIIADHRRAMTEEQAREILDREEREEGWDDGADWHRYSAARDVVAEANRERERAAVRAREDRETDAKIRYDRTNWHDDGQQERGPLDRPGVIERAHAPHLMQGRTANRGHVWTDRAIRPGRDFPPVTRGRGLEERQR